MKKIIIVLCLLLMGTVAYSGTYGGIDREELRNQIRLSLQDTDTSNTTNLRWSSTTINTRIEVAQVDIVARTRCLQSRKKTTLTAEQAEYVWPDDCIAPYRIGYSIAESSVAFERLDWYAEEQRDMEGIWEDDSSGEPQDYHIRRGNRLNVQPKPSSDYAGTNFLQFDYYEIPDSFADDDAIPFNSVNRLYIYHHLIIYYVVAWCLEDERKADVADRYWTLYYKNVGFMKGEINEEPDREGNFVPPERTMR